MIDAVGNPQSLLILGGTSEIGLAVAEKFAAGGGGGTAAGGGTAPGGGMAPGGGTAGGRRGLRVVLAARPSERLDAAAVRLRDLGCEVSTVPFDARAPRTHPEAVDKAFADGDVDVTVVAFGVLGDQERAWTDLDAALELAEVNYTAAVSVGVLVGRKLAEQGHGSLVALSSVAGERARRSNFVYGSTKAGMDAFYSGLTEALRPSGVHVAVVRPGFVHTRMTAGLKPAPLSVSPQQVADVVVDAVRTRREVAWAPAPLRYLMSVLRHIPRPIFRRLPI